jgi:hypothetical protein
VIGRPAGLVAVVILVRLWMAGTVGGAPGRDAEAGCRRRRDRPVALAGTRYAAHVGISETTALGGASHYGIRLATMVAPSSRHASRPYATGAAISVTDRCGKGLVEIRSIREPDGDKPDGMVRRQVFNDAKIAPRCTNSTNLPSGA